MSSIYFICFLPTLYISVTEGNQGLNAQLTGRVSGSSHRIQWSHAKIWLISEFPEVFLNLRLALITTTLQCCFFVFSSENLGSFQYDIRMTRSVNILSPTSPSKNVSNFVIENSKLNLLWRSVPVLYFLIVSDGGLSILTAQERNGLCPCGTGGHAAIQQSKKGERRKRKWELRIRSSCTAVVSILIFIFLWD